MAKLITGKGLKKAIIRGLIYTGGAAAVYAAAEYSINQGKDLESICSVEIAPKHSRQELEGMVKAANTPQEAFIRVSMDIKFMGDGGMVGECPQPSRWLSLQESYSLGEGDCMEGAIAFAAMLSDNPEYETRVVWIKAKPGLKDSEGNPMSAHAIALYKENGKWGYTSFNVNTQNGYGSSIMDAVHEDAEDAIRHCNSGAYGEYTIVEFTPEELKFGRLLQKKMNEKLEWRQL